MSPAVVLRRPVVLGLVATLLLAMLLGGRLGRAEPTGNYRPELLPEALSTGCWPLPGDASFDFPYVVRADGDVQTGSGLRRRLVLHYDLIGSDEATAGIRSAFTDVGFSVTSDPDNPTIDLRGPGPDGKPIVVSARLREFDGQSETSIVRGEIMLDLPAATLSSDDAVCDRPSVTKRFSDTEE